MHRVDGMTAPPGPGGTRRSGPGRLARAGVLVWLIAAILALHGAAVPSGLAAALQQALLPAGGAGLAPVERILPPAALAREAANPARAEFPVASPGAGARASDDGGEGDPAVPAAGTLPAGPPAGAAARGFRAGPPAAQSPAHAFQARGPPHAPA